MRYAYFTKQSTFNLRAIEKFKKKALHYLSFGTQYICSNPLGNARIEGVTKWKSAFWIVELNDAPATIQQIDVLQKYWFSV